MLRRNGPLRSSVSLAAVPKFCATMSFPVPMRNWTTLGPYKPRTGRTVHTGRTGQCMNHAPAILAKPAVYCIHGRIIHQARGRQTVSNVNEKHAPSPSAATANASAVELLKLLIWYNDPVDYKGENGQQ